MDRTARRQVAIIAILFAVIGGLVVATVVSSSSRAEVPSPASPIGTVPSDEMFHPQVNEFSIALKDGRTLDCVYVRQAAGNATSGGPSCDWAHAK